MDSSITAGISSCFQEGGTAYYSCNWDDHAGQGNGHHEKSACRSDVVGAGWRFHCIVCCLPGKRRQKSLEMLLYFSALDIWKYQGSRTQSPETGRKNHRDSSTAKSRNSLFQRKLVFPKEQTREKKNLKILGRLSNRGKLYKTRVAQGCDSVHTNEKMRLSCRWA